MFEIKMIIPKAICLTISALHSITLGDICITTIQALGSRYAQCDMWIVESIYMLNNLIMALDINMWICFLWNGEKLCFCLAFRDIEGCKRQCRRVNEHQACSLWHVDVLVFLALCEMLMFPKFRRISITSFLSILHPVKFASPWTFFTNLGFSNDLITKATYWVLDLSGGL